MNAHTHSAAPTTTCPACNTPNVYVIAGRIARHTEPGDQSSAKMCYAGGLSVIAGAGDDSSAAVLYSREIEG